MADKTIVIKKSVKGIPQGVYTTIEFELPENVKDITIHYSYKKAKIRDKENECFLENLIDIGLVAPDGRQIGASASSYDTIYVSGIYSSNGYEPFDLVAGKYVILVGVDRKKEDFEITYTIEYNFKRYAWLSGDGHLHTNRSDGRYEPAKLVEMCRKKKLDWIIITDHNNCCAQKEIGTYKDICIIPGMELTAYMGHVNMWGVNQPICGSYAFNDFEGMLRLVGEAKQKGAYISVNHPHCKKCGWHMPLEETPMDCVEVWNGPMRIDNMTTVNWWHQQLLLGKRIPAVSGSDYHCDFVLSDLLAYPVMYVYARSNTPKDVLYALVHGHSIMTTKVGATMPYLTVGDKVIGETATTEECDKGRIDVKNMKRGHKLVVYNNDEIIYTYRARKKCDHTANLPPLKKGFVRAEVRFQKNKLSSALHRLAMLFMLPPDAKLPVPELIWAMTNPIWIE